MAPNENEYILRLAPYDNAFDNNLYILTTGSSELNKLLCFWFQNQQQGHQLSESGGDQATNNEEPVPMACFR